MIGSGAVFDLLRVYEDVNHLSSTVDVMKGGANGLDGIKRGLMDALNMGIHWIYEHKNDEDEDFSFELSENIRILIASYMDMPFLIQNSIGMRRLPFL